MKYSLNASKTTSNDKSPSTKQPRRKRRRRKGKPLHREEEVQDEQRPVENQVSDIHSDLGRRVQTSGRKELAGPAHPPKVKYSPDQNNNNRNRTKSSFRTSTPSQSEISGFLPNRQYYQPQEDQETFYINTEGHLQCHQDPQKTFKVKSTQDLPGSREAPIYHKPGSISIKTVDDILKLYPNSFDRLGSLKGAYDIKIDPSVPSVQHARRKVPIESKAAIEEAINYMVQQDILEPQIEPTPWVSSVTYPVKPTGEVRPCLDARDLNKAIIRENHKPQTVEEIAHQLAGAVVFTKADALKAFLQVHLTERSSKLLVINTHKGRYRFKRMPFGAKMSQDVFQLKMDLIMEKCPGVISIHDDIVIYGLSEQDHDANLINLLNVAQTEGLVLNSKKLELKKAKVSFFGAEYSASGMHPCPKKIQGITEMTPPTDKQQLASFLGMVTYMGNFVPHLSHHTEPLRAMLKQDVHFIWDANSNTSFQKIKDLIAKTASQPLRYYDQTKPVTVQADASQRGLGACLVQEGQPIAFASKSLTDTETRYANIERELLAIVFACQRFNTYMLGRQFTVESDHKPLEMIHLKSLASAPPPSSENAPST
ncbi:MAG: RNA-directed DNA polymerase, partial [Proteobacteria bacterium]|nr:RNA-directed DNA polymerase [Pseudomonadota bacterium]